VGPNATITQGGYAGTIQFNFTSVPTVPGNILTVQFTGGVLSGLVGGNSASLSASFPPNTVNYTSSIPGLLTGADLRNFSIGFSGLTSGLSLNNTTVASNTGSTAGTFSAQPIPEPASVVMMSISAIAGLGLYGLRRRFQA